MSNPAPVVRIRAKTDTEAKLLAHIIGLAEGRKVPKTEAIEVAVSHALALAKSGSLRLVADHSIDK